MRICTKCQQKKPIDQFTPDKRIKCDGRRAQCKRCEADRCLARLRQRRIEDPTFDPNAERKRRYHEDAAYRQQVINRQRASRKINNRGAAATRRAAVKRRYGLTLETYEQLLAAGCAICGTQASRLQLDHCHKSGNIRDALCNNCNKGLGLLGDDPHRLLAAAKYLRRF